MQSIGPVYAKGMFGGHGLFIDWLMFALIVDNVQSTSVANNLPAFTYHKKGKIFKMSYYQAPGQSGLFGCIANG